MELWFWNLAGREVGATTDQQLELAAAKQSSACGSGDECSDDGVRVSIRAPYTSGGTAPFRVGKASAWDRAASGKPGIASLI
jgi:hypothetical protein